MRISQSEGVIEQQTKMSANERVANLRSFELVCLNEKAFELR